MLKSAIEIALKAQLEQLHKIFALSSHFPISKSVPLNLFGSVHLETEHGFSVEHDKVFRNAK